MSDLSNNPKLPRLEHRRSNRGALGARSPLGVWKGRYRGGTESSSIALRKSRPRFALVTL